MNDVIEKELNIEDMIYEIRGRQVMLDNDKSVKESILKDAGNILNNYNQQLFYLTNLVNEIII